MDDDASQTLSGRRAEAARNDELIRQAARAVFLEDPTAPIAAVAERAGVGIGALYRRYGSKEGLLQRLALDSLRRYIAAAEAALADEGDPWETFARFMRRSLDAGAHSLSAHLAGAFTPTDELRREGRRAYELTGQIIARAQEAGVLRPDVGVGDISQLFEQLQVIRGPSEAHTSELRHRALTLMLDGLRNLSPTPLPGDPPGWEDLSGRYER